MFSEEMSQKSKVVCRSVYRYCLGVLATYCFFGLIQVPLGILKKCETKHEDMISILDHLSQYVPTVSSASTMTNPHTSEPVEVVEDKHHQILFGGDMLTAKRARVAQYIRENSNRGKFSLEGFVPCTEDWHTKMCLNCVSIYS